MSRPWGGRALVLGGGLAGLLAARVLAPRFGEVLLVERDRLAEADGPARPRKGAPQGRHVHGLLPGGAAALERLLPGVLEDLEADGALPADLGADMRWFHHGRHMPRPRSGLVGWCQTRPLLERHLRRRCLAPANVAVRDGWEALGLVAAGTGGAVAGAELRPLGGGGSVERVAADLVVDATGRGSRAGAWLAALGHERPPEVEVRVDVTYTSRLYRPRPGDAGRDGARVFLVHPRPPAERCGGAAMAVEGGRWLVTLVGWLGERAPANEAGFLAYARGLPAPDLHDLVSRAEPASGFAVHRFPSDLRRRYEALRRPPAGFLAVGDALCGFNPVYGQGATVAALEAEALGWAMAATEARGRGPGALPAAFFRVAAAVVGRPWAMAAGQDLRFAGGPRPRGAGLLGWYADRLHEAAAADPAVHRAFLEAMDLRRSPASLFRPGVAARVLRHRLAGGRGR